MAGSENTAPEAYPFAKPLSIAGIHFGNATNCTTNLNIGQLGSSLIIAVICTIGFAWFHIMKFNAISGHAM